MTLGPVRFSHLRAYGRSAMHGWHARNNEMDATSAIERGAGVDAIIFGTSKVVAYPGAVRRGKEYDAFVAANPGAQILTATEYAKVTRMADAVMSNPLAAPYMKGVTQQTKLFRWMGLDCRSTPDVIGDSFLTELKTSATSEPVKFTWHALRMAYHAQMRMQQIAIASRVPCFVVCVEATEPHPVTVFEIDKQTLELGEKLLVLWAERLKAAEQAQQFPPYAQSVFPLCAPEDLELDYEGAA